MNHILVAVPHIWWLLSLLPFVFGATITPTNNINPTTMIANWSKGVAANAQKWLNKYLNPKAVFNANPAQAQINWQAGINAAIARGTYATNLGKADLTLAANNASTFGVQNYAAAGTQKVAKYAAKAPSLASAMTSLRATINSMPNATLEDRIARSAAWARGLAALKGTF